MLKDGRYIGAHMDVLIIDGEHKGFRGTVLKMSAITLKGDTTQVPQIVPNLLLSLFLAALINTLTLAGRRVYRSIDSRC